MGPHFLQELLKLTTDAAELGMDLGVYLTR